MNELERDIARLIVETLALDHLRPEDIAAEQPLFGQGLGLDSVDALELALALQNRYGLRIAADSRDARAHFETVRSLALYVQASGSPCAG
ncbi:phosphopantetheine-binding protein [Luteibacter sp. 329MFSha]|uniref:phosphopantetheine-binding protein n=1 Tax=Luteibacter sp. 329MFSha TaxID=1798239 RepID=UPI0008D8C083|nr:phosphopantetheine-binding protein [Luteibacter sp. 329MFSha]SEV85662.1 acyl carrier protein [Luteibacter sp. 329MFSha]